MKPFNKLLLCFFLCISGSNAFTQTSNDTWGVKFSNALIYRYQPTVNALTNKGWEYSNTIMTHGMEKVFNQVPDSTKYLNYIKAYIDTYVNGSGVISATINSLDRTHPGISCLFLYEKTGLLQYKTAATTLRNMYVGTSATYPKTATGKIFWHKNNGTYNDMVLIDGIYMLHPFLARYGSMFGDNAAIDTAVNQTLYVYYQLYDNTKHLIKHGWNPTKTQAWADPVTGNSSEVWSRGMGWYTMALVDILKYVPASHPRRAELINALSNLAVGIQTYQDAATGLWYQVVDKGTSLTGNYLETSGSAMFVYALKVGVDSGWISSSYLPVATKAWNYLKNTANVKISIHTDGYAKINDFAPAMGVQTSAANYVQVSLQPVDCPGTAHPHGYGAILMTASVMEFPLALDTQAPSAPVLSSTGTTSTTISLSWTAATDNVGVTGYDVYVDAVLKTTTTGLTYTVTGLTASTAYSIYVKAKDAAGNNTNSNTIAVSTQAADTQPPSAPVLSSTGTTSTTISLSWTAATDNVGVTGYDVYVDAVLKTTTTGLTYTVTGLTASTAYSIYVKAKDAAGNNTNSNTIAVSTQAADTQPPSAPVLSSTGTTSTTISLSWTAATDNVGVTGYDVYVDAVLKTTTTGLTYTVTGLTASTAYSIYVKAKDAAGNSTNSNTISVTTQVASGPTTLFAHYFETGWDGWADGGVDCARYSGSRSYQGSSSIYIRDNSGTASAMTSAAFNVSTYNQLVIDFYFYANSMESGEDFWVRYYNGSTWTTVATYVAGTNFNNNGFYHGTLTLANVTFPANAQFRFQCDASDDADLIYIDQVTVTGSNTALRSARLVNTQTCDLVGLQRAVLETTDISNHLAVYPNPAKNNLSIQTDETISDVKIYDASGLMVKQFGNMKSGSSLSISTLKAGLYIIRFKAEDGKLVIRKFIKQ